MKDEMLKFLDKVSEMREAQRAFFDAKKRGDHTSLVIYLGKAKLLEKEVDKMYKELSDKMKNGEQSKLF